jgi:hypothetical protein
MREIGFDVVVDVLVAIGSALAAVGFTVAGVLVDQAGLHNLLAGATAQGAWELWMGTLALFVGIYLFGYRTALPAIVGRR